MVKRWLSWVLMAAGGCTAGSIDAPARPISNLRVSALDAGVETVDAGSACQPEAASLLAQIFTPQCATAGCHGGTRPAAALDLSVITFPSLLVDQTATSCDGQVLVFPGNPDASLLMAKLDHRVPAGCGTPMPPTTMLSAQDIDCVRRWIAQLPPTADAGPVDTCERCGGTQCIDLASDSANCGACGAACGAGRACSAGQCSCPAGLTACGGTCVDLATSESACGSCGTVCPASSVCQQGQCTCGPGLTACGGACVELATDPLNCGGCNVKCGAGTFCTPTGCSTAASCQGLTQCAGACVDTSSSLTNCGGCGIACGAGQVCTSGQCVCPGGGSLCGGSCVDKTADRSNCGQCGNVCPAVTSCVSGSCSCPNGGVLCGGSCVDVASDPNHCGSCGSACGAGQACVQGVCACSGPVLAYATGIAPILDRSCTNSGCHSGTQPKAGLSLTPATSYAELVNVRASQCSDGRLLVKGGSASSSYLWQKLLGTNLCSGSQMPKAGTSLPQADLDAISSWICRGAPP